MQLQISFCYALDDFLTGFLNPSRWDTWKFPSTYNNPMESSSGVGGDFIQPDTFTEGVFGITH